ncbi:hypothetical protein ROA7023_03569 [Roseisalinus antarcticus]|uniref:Uncharacterized protein n=1 Tax=Roseisalinus antarcticus TaxID=254357 RepID=A0A1Y5TTA6_9RHOB|nr:hypothetical protein ROA7023_03569 [Roseisalinus antarcticus]
MHDIQTRMTGLHQLLTGGPGQPAWRSVYPPRHLWGDNGLAEGRAPAPRRRLPVRLRWW